MNESNHPSQLRGTRAALALATLSLLACSASPAPVPSRAPPPTASNSMSAAPSPAPSFAERGPDRGRSPARAAADSTPTFATWLTDESKARNVAARENKPLLIFFCAAWCDACKELRASTFADARFLDVAGRFVLLQLDGTDDGQPAFAVPAARYGIKGVPGIVVEDSKGNVVRIFRKKPETDELLGAMRKAP